MSSTSRITGLIFASLKTSTCPCATHDREHHVVLHTAESTAHWSLYFEVTIKFCFMPIGNQPTTNTWLTRGAHCAPEQGLYLDDGLAWLKDASGPMADRKRTQVTESWKLRAENHDCVQYEHCQLSGYHHVLTIGNIQVIREPNEHVCEHSI